MITSPVYDPAHDGKVEEVAAWLKKNPDEINNPISDGYTLLHIACIFGRIELARFLVSREALLNINADNDSGATPLHEAVGYRDEEVADQLVRLLIDFGAELNAPQKGGQTALHHAVARGSLKLVTTLIQAGADPFLKDELGHTPVSLAKDLKTELDVAEAIRSQLKQALA
jgi:ankyrin repeat protein